MSYFRITGGVPLKGKVNISGSKNAAIKMIGAALLTSEPVSLTNVPEIGDVRVDLEVVKTLGVKAEKNKNELVLEADELATSEIPEGLSTKTRAAIITMGPLLARRGKVIFSGSGGCNIGKRPIDRHLSALESLGVSVEWRNSTIVAKTERLRGGIIRFEKNTVMGTETALLASVLAEGETKIFGAAMEPEVNDLIALLRKMGAQISRSEEHSREITVQGVEELSGASHEVIPDRNEAVTFAVAAAVTRGDVVLKNLRTEDIIPFLSKLNSMGVSYDASGDSLRVWSEKEDVWQAVDIQTSPYPGFMTDWQQPFSVLLSQAEGTSTVHEAIYPDRLGYLAELGKMGVDYDILTPKEAGIPFKPEEYGFDWRRTSQPKVIAKIHGPIELRGAELEIPDLRAGATLAIAALAAEGESNIRGTHHIERGYEKFEEKLQNLGAEIERIEE